MPPPTAEPASPIRTVSQNGIGSGPGTANRAAPPIRKPDSTTARIPPIRLEPYPAVRPGSLHVGLRASQRSRLRHRARERPHRPGVVARPVTLFTGQWADLPLADLAAKAGDWGFDGL